MHLLLRVVAAIAAVSVVFTVTLIAMFVASRGISSMLQTGPLGIMTLIGWALTLTLGPIAAVQLWRHRESGRLAGLVIFAFGVVYYLAGFFWLGTPAAQSGQIIGAAIGHAVPLVILSLPQARRACS